MRYVSTRGGSPAVEFEEALLAGLAGDGGLFVPEEWPRFDTDFLRGLRGKPYADIAYEVMRPFIGDALDDDALRSIVRDSYAGFDHPAVAPLRQIDANLFLLELFHGPTLAFKDFALQVLGRLFDHVLTRRNERMTIVGATSGDTGSAAIEACRNRAAIEIFILHPKGRVSEMQRRQMTTVPDENVHNIAIDGNFDDCQDLVKAMFNDESFRDAMHLSAVNSINWARIMAQIVYYFSAAIALGAPDRPVSFSVPTGNFGDVFAGYAAARCGLPIEQLVIATNANDIMARFFESGEMTARPVTPTLSPAMDIQVSSNFERLLFDMHKGDGRIVAQAMTAFRESGTLSVSRDIMDDAGKLFAAERLDDEGIRRVIADTLRDCGILIDPHTATGLHAAAVRRRDPAVPMVALATAHPAKFSEAVLAACGTEPALPPALASLAGKAERLDVLPNDLGVVQDFVRQGRRSA